MMNQITMSKANHSDWYYYNCRSSAYIYWDYAWYFYIMLHERHQTASIGRTESDGIKRHPLDGWNQIKSIELITHLLATKNFGLASRCHILTPSTWHGHSICNFLASKVITALPIPRGQWHTPISKSQASYKVMEAVKPISKSQASYKVTEAVKPSPRRQ